MLNSFSLPFCLSSPWCSFVRSCVPNLCVSQYTYAPRASILTSLNFRYRAYAEPLELLQGNAEDGAAFIPPLFPFDRVQNSTTLLGSQDGVNGLLAPLGPNVSFVRISGAVAHNDSEQVLNFKVNGCGSENSQTNCIWQFGGGGDPLRGSSSTSSVHWEPLANLIYVDFAIDLRLDNSVPLSSKLEIQYRQESSGEWKPVPRALIQSRIPRLKVDLFDSEEGPSPLMKLSKSLASSSLPLYGWPSSSTAGLVANCTMNAFCLWSASPHPCPALASHNCTRFGLSVIRVAMFNYVRSGVFCAPLDPARLWHGHPERWWSTQTREVEVYRLALTNLTDAEGLDLRLDEMNHVEYL